MTLICARLSNVCTVHATDSLLTRLTPEGKREAIPERRPKIIAIPRFRGAMSWWGATQRPMIRGGWDAIDWLIERAAEAEETELSADDPSLATLSETDSATPRQRQGYPCLVIESRH